MPSVSRKQQSLMHAIASGNIPAGHGRPSKKVAREFVAADHKRGKAKLPMNVGKTIVENRPVRSK